MLDTVDTTLQAQVAAWLADFEKALAASSATELEALFHPEGYWRDVLSFTWRFTTVAGAAAIGEALARRAAEVAACEFDDDCGRTPPRTVTRAGVECIEAFHAFKTRVGRGEGVVRLVPHPDDPQRLVAWTLLTALDAIAGVEETVGKARPTGNSYARDFRGPNWQDLRDEAVAFADRDPAVLIVGGGQAGLSTAARLSALGVDTLIVDRNPRVGDNWRLRYHALVLHNQVHVNHLPYMPFPPTWPSYIAKDKLAGWFEAYAEAMEINFWTDTELTAGSYDASGECWNVTLTHADGSTREMRPRHVVMATGASCIPRRTEIPTLENFRGEVLHSGSYTDAGAWVGKRALVLGTGTSGHDIAQDLHSNGVHVTIVQRSPTLVVNVEPSAQLPYALYDEGPSLEDCDLLVTATPYEVARTTHRMLTEQAEALDQALLDALAEKGFRLSSGIDGTGWQFLYLTRGGGYYFNVGCSELIASGDVGLLQYQDIEAFVADGVKLRDGSHVAADLVVTATGFYGQDELVRRIFGDGVADRVGQVWGFDDNDELAGMYCRTGQPRMWFIAGSLAQCRIFSKYLGLQIKACEEGLIPA